MVVIGGGAFVLYLQRLRPVTEPRGLATCHDVGLVVIVGGGAFVLTDRADVEADADDGTQRLDGTAGPSW